jgi:transcriptional regulator with XRE-family HTH domain
LDELPDQDELRRRLRAARALKDLSVVDLAKLMPSDAKLSLSTLRKVESGERKLDVALLRELAARIGVPFAWFTVPDVGLAVLGAGSDSLEDRVLAVEAAQAALARDLRRLADPPGATRHVLPGGDRG